MPCRRGQPGTGRAGLLVASFCLHVSGPLHLGGSSQAEAEGEGDKSGHVWWGRLAGALLREDQRDPWEPRLDSEVWQTGPGKKPWSGEGRGDGGKVSMTTTM